MMVGQHQGNASIRRFSILGLATLSTIVSLILPWARFGTKSHNSFDVFRFIHLSRLIPAPDASLAFSRFTWLLAPFLLVVGTLLFVAELPVLGVAILALSLGYIALVAVATMLLFGLTYGPPLALAGSLGCVGGAFHARRAAP